MSFVSSAITPPPRATSFVSSATRPPPYATALVSSTITPPPRAAPFVSSAISPPSQPALATALGFSRMTLKRRMGFSLPLSDFASISS